MTPSTLREPLSEATPHHGDSNIATPLSNATDGTELLLEPAKIGRILLVAIGVLVVCGTVANVVIYHVAPTPESDLARVMHRFDLGHEPSIPAWYSSLALASCGGLLGVIAIAKKHRRQPDVAHWTVLMVIFFLMALDEAVMIHEMVDTALHRWLNTSGIFYFAWVIPGALLVMAVSIAYLNFVRRLDTRTRRLFVLSAALFVSGAIGMELIASIIFSSGLGEASLAHTASQSVEEALEMLGIALFLYALLDLLAREFGQIVVRIGSAHASPDVDFS